MSLRYLGSEFHADGLANEKALLPSVDVFRCVTSFSQVRKVSFNSRIELRHVYDTNYI